MKLRQSVGLAGIGLFGFILLYISRIIILLVSLDNLSIIGVLTPASPPLTQTLLVLILLPIFIILGASIVSKALGMSRKQALLAGTIAFIVATYLQYANKNYSPFNVLDTAFLVLPVVVTILISTVLKKRIVRWKKILIFVLSAVFLLMIFLPTETRLWIALSAWLILPVFSGALLSPR